MPSFEEMKRRNAVPEGVRDEQDYREYLEEKKARESEAAANNGSTEALGVETISENLGDIVEPSQVESPENKPSGLKEMSPEELEERLKWQMAEFKEKMKDLHESARRWGGDKEMIDYYVEREKEIEEKMDRTRKGEIVAVNSKDKVGTAYEKEQRREDEAKKEERRQDEIKRYEELYRENEEYWDKNSPSMDDWDKFRRMQDAHEKTQSRLQKTIEKLKKESDEYYEEYQIEKPESKPSEPEEEQWGEAAVSNSDVEASSEVVGDTENNEKAADPAQDSENSSSIDKLADDIRKRREAREEKLREQRKILHLRQQALEEQLEDAYDEPGVKSGLRERLARIEDALNRNAHGEMLNVEYLPSDMPDPNRAERKRLEKERRDKMREEQIAERRKELEKISEEWRNERDRDREERLYRKMEHLRKDIERIENGASFV